MELEKNQIRIKDSKDSGRKVYRDFFLAQDGPGKNPRGAMVLLSY